MIGLITDSRHALIARRASLTVAVVGESSEVRIEVLNDAAIETGKVYTVGTRAQKKIAETTRYTDFWVKVQGKWLLLAEHSSFITNP